MHPLALIIFMYLVMFQAVIFFCLPIAFENDACSTTYFILVWLLLPHFGLYTFFQIVCSVICHIGMLF